MNTGWLVDTVHFTEKWVRFIRQKIQNVGAIAVNIEEAKKVLWLKSNPRPIGELLKEGYHIHFDSRPEIR